jgi:hypothetical protein
MAVGKNGYLAERRVWLRGFMIRLDLDLDLDGILGFQRNDLLGWAMRLSPYTPLARESHWKIKKIGNSVSYSV